MPSTSTPVAIGSKVPAWPTLRVPARRRVRPTTSWLVQPCGLSMMTRPEPMGSVGFCGAVFTPSSIGRFAASFRPPSGGRAPPGRRRAGNGENVCFASPRRSVTLGASGHHPWSPSPHQAHSFRSPGGRRGDCDPPRPGTGECGFRVECLIPHAGCGPSPETPRCFRGSGRPSRPPGPRKTEARPPADAGRCPLSRASRRIIA